MAAQIDFRGKEIEQLKKEAEEGGKQEALIAKILSQEDEKEVLNDYLVIISSLFSFLLIMNVLIF